jgi:hypothetical protein
MAIASLPYYAGALFGRNALRLAPPAAMGVGAMNASMPTAIPMSQVGGDRPFDRLMQLRQQEQVVDLANQQRFRPMPTQVPMPVNPAEVPLPAFPAGVPMPAAPAEVPMMPQMGGAAYRGNEQRFRPMPAAPRGGGGAMQGPPMPSEYAVPGFAKGYANAAPGMSAQQYADQFAGGDLSKVKARQIMVDGQLVNDFYTKGLMEGLLGGPAAMQPLQGTPADVPLPPQRPAEFGPSNTSGGFSLSGLLGSIFGG